MVLLMMAGLGLVAACAWMLVLWFVQLATKNGAMVDVGWSVGVFIYAAIYFGFTQGIQPYEAWFLGALVIWAARLTCYLFVTRILGGREERRYQEMRVQWAPRVQMRFLVFYQTQAAFNLLLSVPFLMVALNPDIGNPLFLFFGVLVMLIGVVGETSADVQLHSFKKSPKNHGKICRVGLWNYSRHPNYFFEFVVWIGIFVVACGVPYGWIGCVAPALILWTLLRVTGIPTIEEHALRTKGNDFKSYQNEVSIFFPLPRRKMVIDEKH